MPETTTTASSEQQQHQHQQREEMWRFGRRLTTLDVVVHLNALLPCLVVWWTLAVVRSAWLAVVMYEAVCLVGLPLLTLSLRPRDESRMTVTRLRPLVHSLTKPQDMSRCALVTTGSLCLVGMGGFAAYLVACQKEFEVLGISTAIHTKSSETGLGGGYSLIALGVWFCTVNPVLEEIYWRGYCYTEFGRMFSHGRREHKERGLLLQPLEQTATTRWLLSFYFASFHAIVVALFVSWVAAFVAFLFLAGVSRLWIWFAEHPPFGFPFVVAFHAGADVAVVLVFTALDFGWATKKIAFTAALTASIVLALLGVLLLGLAWRHEPEMRPPACCLSNIRRGRATSFFSSFGTATSSRADDHINTPLVFMPEPPVLVSTNGNSSVDHLPAPPSSPAQHQDRLPSP